MTTPLRIVTRATELAQRRARGVRTMLEERGVAAEVQAIRTTGDRHFEEPFQPISARDLFTREVDAALLRGKADIAVHAVPDLPTERAQGLAIAAVLPRDDPRDVLVLNELFEATSLAELPRGTRLGTPSMRCRGLLASQYPDIEVVQLRGDLPTRLRKVDDGQVHATIVSAAALHHLDVSQRIAAFLEGPDWLPAPGQGAIALIARSDEAETIALVRELHDARTMRHIAAERALLAALEGGLQSPVSALVVDDGHGEQTLHAIIVDPQGRQLLRGHLPLDDSNPELIGVRLANELRNRGASRILDAVRGAARVPTPQPD